MCCFLLSTFSFTFIFHGIIFTWNLLSCIYNAMQNTTNNSNCQWFESQLLKRTQSPIEFPLQTYIYLQAVFYWICLHWVANPLRSLSLSSQSLHNIDWLSFLRWVGSAGCFVSNCCHCTRIGCCCCCCLFVSDFIKLYCLNSIFRRNTMILI